MDDSLPDLVTTTVHSADFYLQVIAIAVTAMVSWLLSRIVKRKIIQISEDEERPRPRQVGRDHRLGRARLSQVGRLQVPREHPDGGVEGYIKKRDELHRGKLQLVAYPLEPRVEHRNTLDDNLRVPPGTQQVFAWKRWNEALISHKRCALIILRKEMWVIHVKQVVQVCEFAITSLRGPQFLLPYAHDDRVEHHKVCTFTHRSHV